MIRTFVSPVLWTQIQNDMTTAEKKFAECVSHGRPCRLGESVPQMGHDGNTIRAKVIRFFAYGGDAEIPVRGSSIHLQGAWISGGNGDLLDLTYANIPGGLIFMDCHFEVAVSMLHAECKGLHMNGSHMAGCLRADGLKTEGDVHLSGGFSASGGVRLVGAKIGGSLDCTGGKFEIDDPEGNALIAQMAKIDGTFLWQEICGSGIIDLTGSKASILADDANSWKPFKVVLDGFTYDQIVGPTDADSRLKWLANRPSKLPDGIPLSFSPLPYEQAAKVLFGMGHDNDAWEILLEKERIRMRQEKESGGTFSPVAHEAATNVLFAMGRGREARGILWEKEDLLTKRGDFPRWWKFGRRVWDFLAGYGYRPWKRTFAISSLVIAIGAGVFWCANEAGRMVPHQPAALASVKYQYGRIPSETPGETVARKFPGYPEFNPLLFSADIFVPLLNLHQEPFWYPAPDGGRPSWFRAPKGEGFSLWFLLEWWYWFQIAAGAVLTSMFLLSVTGLLRPRQSSGEKG